jgi:hypothetical protein
VKALTLTPPWSTLVVLGAKRIETRDWAAPDDMNGQRLAIHAGKNLAPVGGEKGLRAQCAVPVFQKTLFGPSTPYLGTYDLPRGVVVAIVTVNACVPTESIDFDAPPPWLEPGEHEAEFGNYSPGRWAWQLTDLEVLAEPVPATGHQKLWEWRR